jgi:hypothetical protein
MALGRFTVRIRRGAVGLLLGLSARTGLSPSWWVVVCIAALVGALSAAVVVTAVRAHVLAQPSQSLTLEPVEPVED